MIFALWASAWSGEARVVVVEPGLPLVGEVLATLDTGFRVRVPQGVVFVPFEAVLDLRDPAPDEQPQVWEVVLVGDPRAVDAIRASLSLRPGVHEATLSEALRQSASSCGASASCVAALAPAPGAWFVISASVGDDGPSLVGRAPFDRADRAVPLDTTTPDTAWASIGAALGVEPDAAPAEWPAAWAPLRGPLVRVVRPEPVRDRPAAPDHAALAFVPFPGLPSLARRDWAGFAGALSVTAVTTTAWTFASGAVSTTQGEHAALGVLGSYAGSVSVSSLFALRRGPAVSVVPSQGGVSVAVAGAW